MIDIFSVDREGFKNNSRYFVRNILRAGMENLKFENVITVRTDPAGGIRTLADISSCTGFLLREWPGRRGDKHRAALQACSDASSGKKSPDNARRAFVLAAREAGIMINQ